MYCVGNSLFKGDAAAPLTVEFYLQAALGEQALFTRNWGVNGWKNAQLIADFPVKAPQIFPSFRGVVCVMEGGNAILFDGVDAVTCVAQLLTICDLYRSIGCKVALANIAARADLNAIGQATRLAVNALLATGVWHGHADAFVDVAAVMNDPFDLTKYYVDNLHWVALGNQDVAALFAAQVLPLLSGAWPS